MTFETVILCSWLYTQRNNRLLFPFSNMKLLIFSLLYAYNGSMNIYIFFESRRVFIIFYFLFFICIPDIFLLHSPPSHSFSSYSPSPLPPRGFSPPTGPPPSLSPPSYLVYFLEVPPTFLP